jgi:hypothetical protein
MSTLSMCRGKPYLFGGFSVNTSDQYYNDLFRIDINLEDKSAKFVLINAENKPPSRSSHGMIDLSDNHLLVIGGEGDRDDSDEK